MTIPEYELLIEAHRLKDVDNAYNVHLQAWLSFAVKAEKKVGKYKSKPVYDKFDKFFNYKAAIEKAKQTKPEKGKYSRVMEILGKGE